MKKRQIPLFSHPRCLIFFSILGILILSSCVDDNETGTINSSPANVIQLSIPDAELVQVRSVATGKECMISNLQVLIYNDAHTAAPVYYQEGKSTQLSFLFGNGTASPTITLTDYIPQNGDRVYVLCNMTDRTSINETTSEDQLKNYSSQGQMKGFSSSQKEERTIPMYGWIEWNEAATSNVCLLTRCLAKIVVNANLEQLFPDKKVYWEWKNLNFSDFILDSDNQGDIYKGNINENGISEKHDLLSAITPIDESKGLVTSYYPLEYKHSIYALGKEVDKNKFSVDRAMLLLTVQNMDGSDKEYYRLDFWDKSTGAYWDILRNHSYNFNISKLKSKGYATTLEAIQNPGSNIEYSVTVSDNWSQGFASNGQYLLKTDRESIELLRGIEDPVVMVKIELQADDSGNANFDNVTTRRIRALGMDKKTLFPYSQMQMYYSIDNKTLIPIKKTTESNLSDSEVDLPVNSNKYWIYACVSNANLEFQGYLEITIGNIIKYIPIKAIEHSKANPIDESGPANSFITPITYGIYSFDATVIGNGVDGIVAETKNKPAWSGQLKDDLAMYHFKNAMGEDISVSKNVAVEPKSAKLIWQDKDNLISQVAFNSETNRVEFLSNGAGNGVIAVYDNSDPNAADANVLWSWHIWCTEQPDIIELGLPTNGEVYSGINYRIMDRDLGATTCTPDELTTRGMGYQWGRKDPFIGSASFESTENAPMYDVRGIDLDFEKIEINEKIGTIEYAIRHPNVFILGDMGDWLYYSYSLISLAGNQYLWGNNPYSRNKMVNIKTMKTLYDPCPAGFKIPPSDIYGAFLKKKIIKKTVNPDYQVGVMDSEKFYTPSFTQYGGYFYYGGESNMRKVYFTPGPVRDGENDFNGFQTKDYYMGHMAATMTADDGNGSTTVIAFGFSISTFDFGCSFGGDYSFCINRCAAASIRCVRDE